MRKNISLTLYLVILCLSCGSKVFQEKLSDINRFTYTPELKTHSISVHVEGHVACPCKLAMKMNGKLTNSIINLEGSVNEYYSKEWYQDELGFFLDKPECSGENTIVTVKFNQ